MEGRGRAGRGGQQPPRGSERRPWRGPLPGEGREHSPGHTVGAQQGCGGRSGSVCYSQGWAHRLGLACLVALPASGQPTGSPRRGLRGRAE